MSNKNAKGPRQVELIGPAGGVMTYSIAGGLILAGPIAGWADGSLATGLWWGVFTLPIGIGLAVSTYGWRWDEKRFRAAGIAATAEILAVNRIRGSDEGQDIAELTVRISGPGFDTFDAGCEVPTGSVRPQVGDRRTVMVEPSDLTFAIGYDHLFQHDWL
ncbi:hypothetical protein [Rhodococcus sp. W8901]|uniref:hypothetical protein n=2 Tax=unclassified Rhodococcus (in: high G+C Gram-positive bacteria) TaxID=192944 RepID=UPI00158318EA|nr:hypothetical protein [Rhodococcus sp. W8901]QKT13709.1 hypothetical protein HUN07_25795 [Rhodococcus sp. W8901]